MSQTREWAWRVTVEAARRVLGDLRVELAAPAPVPAAWRQLHARERLLDAADDARHAQIGVAVHDH